VGADEYMLSVDAEQGVLLRTEAREQPFKVIEMTEVEFDVDLPPGTFKIDLPNGETFEDVSQRGKAFWPCRRVSSPGCGSAKASCPGGYSRRDTARGSSSGRLESLCNGSGERTVGHHGVQLSHQSGRRRGIRGVSG
jgi:hypothetical protein